MEIKIYQIDMERDKNRVAFERLEHLEKYQGSAEVDAALYDKVFEGRVDCANLEQVYEMFNLRHPEGYRGRSLSVADVVEVMDGAGKSTFYFCDSIGFQEISFEPAKTVALAAEQGGKDGWRIERCYLEQPGEKALDVIAGTFFLCGGRGEEFVSLSPEQIGRFKERFREPLREQVQQKGAKDKKPSVLAKLHQYSNLQKAAVKAAAPARKKHQDMEL